jgi:hypothetical protein
MARTLVMLVPELCQLVHAVTRLEELPTRTLDDVPLVHSWLKPDEVFLEVVLLFRRQPDLKDPIFFIRHEEPDVSSEDPGEFLNLTFGVIVHKRSFVIRGVTEHA